MLLNFLALEISDLFLDLFLCHGNIIFARSRNRSLFLFINDVVNIGVFFGVVGFLATFLLLRLCNPEVVDIILVGTWHMFVHLLEIVVEMSSLRHIIFIFRWKLILLPQFCKLSIFDLPASSKD